ncbi:cold-shock protein [Stenotrophomonas panacihumi]|uniref:Cold-shock protein n=1 Tax=Stenotrophomonas panacihumi TaxID=676599 RepID=A0A0R0A4J9_9GAMM|nr:cold shock domain-containing protein [Stenotrophomonas panacihumi]KRG40086.1 cold-shock protein [Stenotrophomonas panacihumi]PTN53583.1 cold-shock protein [Stenotrophomonas panacihumi]
MRTHGTLTKWNDERGFGFIAPASGGEEVFAHISAFPRDGQRPRLNEVVSFDLEQGPNGKPRAARIMRPGQARTPSRRPRTQPRQRRGGLLSTVLLPLAAIGGIVYYNYFRTTEPAYMDSGETPVITDTLEEPSDFQCDGRTMCSQMTSCAEATYFIRHCPHTKMDGNHDGVPCEQQWCG